MFAFLIKLFVKKGLTIIEKVKLAGRLARERRETFQKIYEVSMVIKRIFNGPFINDFN